MGKISSLLLLLSGIGLIIFGGYVSHEASLGEQKVSQAEETDQRPRRPITGPVRRRTNEQANETVQEKLSKAEQTVATSEVTANWLLGTGIVLFLVGLGGLILPRKKRT